MQSQRTPSFIASSPTDDAEQPAAADSADNSLKPLSNPTDPISKPLAVIAQRVWIAVDENWW